MSGGTSENLVASAESDKVGPDYFAFYKCELKRLLSQDDDDDDDNVEGLLPVAAGNSSGEREVKKPKVESKPSSSSSSSRGSLFSNSVGDGISDHKRERLNSVLRRALAVLIPEADGMLDPVLAMRQLQSDIKSRKVGGTTCDSETMQKNKTIKISSSLSNSHVSTKSCREVDGDLQFLLQTDASLVEETLEKYSDQLFTTLSHMEKQLEELLDTVVSKCRPMTLTEKQNLQKFIQKLPPKNLNRVAEIVQHSKPESQSCEEIFIDLELEDNITLWRLYYYIEAVEKARKLSS